MRPIRCQHCDAPGHLAPESPAKTWTCPQCLKGRDRLLPRASNMALVLFLVIGCVSCGGIQVDREDARAVLRSICRTVTPHPEDPLAFRIVWAVTCSTVK